VASDPTNGPLISVVDGCFIAWAKEGSLTAATWTEEYDSGGAEAVAVAG